MQKNDLSWQKSLLEVKKVLDSLGVKFWLCGTLLDRALKKESSCQLGRINIRINANDWTPEMHKKLKEKGFNCEERERKINGDRITTLVIISKGESKILMRLMYYYPPEDVYLLLDHDVKKKLGKVPGKFYKKDVFIEFLGEKFRVPDNPAELLQYFRGKREKLSLDKYTRWLSQHLKERRK